MYVRIKKKMPQKARQEALEKKKDLVWNKV